MAQRPYETGDTALLRADFFQGEDKPLTCSIVDVLPNVNAVAQYRVRVDGEVFDRHVSALDLDYPLEQTDGNQAIDDAAEQSSSWIDERFFKVK